MTESTPSRTQQNWTERREGELYDPTLTFQLENGFEAVCALPDSLQDPAVDNWAAYIVWSRPAARPTVGS